MSQRSTVVIAFLIATTGSQPLRAQPNSSAVWDSIAGILQTPAVPSGGYQRYNLPRRDLTLRVGDLAVSPSLGLGAWVGFAGAARDATMMGDLVLISTELKPVLAEFVRQDISVTAIHNHLAGESPSIRQVHFHAQGNAVDLARRIDRVVAHTATPRPVTAGAPRAPTFDTAAVYRALGTSGRAQGDVASLAFMLIPGPVTMHGHAVEASLALRSPVSIQMIDSTRAVATGDFTVLGPRVDPVLDALANTGIMATALHSHMVGEQPTTYYIHFWADGRPADVLRGLRAAADAGRSP